MRYRKLLTFLLSATTACQFAPALAREQKSTADDAGEIIVTARQRNERLIDVPVAVTAINSQDLARYAAKSLSDIAQLAPQVTIAKQASGGGNSFVIRGIGSSTLDTGFDQSVSINVDGVLTSRGRSLQQSYFDVAQVEILKGPQALFFGKNSPAGVISLTSANPTEQFSAGGTVGYEFEDHELIGNAYISAPITDKLGIRVAVQARRSRGWIERVPRNVIPGGELASGLDMQPADRWGPREREIIGRVTLAYKPTDELDLNFKFSTGKSTDNGEGTNGEIVFCGTGVVTNGGPADPYADCTANKKVSAVNVPPEILKGVIAAGDGASYSRYRPTLASLTANWNTDKVELTSVTGYYQYVTSYFQAGFEKTIFALNFGSQWEKYKAFSQEFRALTKLDGPLNFMVGAYYQDTSLNNKQSFRIAALPADPANGYYQSISKGGAVDSTTYSVFGQATLKLAESVELAGGVRWTHEKKDVAQTNTYVHPLLAAAFPIQNFPGKYSDDNISPEATITWHPTSNSTLYAAYKTGYKSGGFGLPAILSVGTVSSDFTFGPEKVKGGEIGAKGQFLDGRLVLNSAIYLYDYSGLQVDIFDGSKITYQVFNAGSARTKGAEIDVRYSPVQDLTLRAAVGYNKARYRNFLSACYAGQTVAQGCGLQMAGGVGTRQDLSGSPTVRAPDWSYSVGFRYNTPVSGNWKLGVTGDVVGVSKFFFSETEGPGTLQTGYAKINASLRLYQEDERVSVSLIGKNLTNKYTVVGGSDRPNSGSGTGTNAGVPADILGYMDRPREIMLQVGFKY